MNPDQGNTSNPVTSRPRLPALLLRALLPVVVLVLGWAGFLILSVEPEEAKRPEQKPRLIKTRVQELRAQDYPTIIRTRGSIRPHNEVTLTAEVAGKIVRLSPAFEDGAFFDEGEVLLELDHADYEVALIAAEAQRARAATILAQEETRVKQARLNWEDLNYEDEPSELVLRLPQLREAEANLASAKAQVERAKRDLERTRVRAPFAGRVRSRAVGLGQSIGPSTPLGVAFAVDYAEVRLPITPRDMAFLSLPEDPEDPAVEVELRDALNEESTTVWRAEIIRTEGALDESSLELFAIARIDDPFGRESGEPPLRIGQPVVASIPGRVLRDVIAVPRLAVRQLDRIFMVDPEELTIEARTIEPLWSDEENVVIRDATIDDGAWLSTTHLIYAPDGSKVEILPDPNLETPGVAGVETGDATGVEKEVQ